MTNEEALTCPSSGFFFSVCLSGFVCFVCVGFFSPANRRNGQRTSFIFFYYAPQEWLFVDHSAISYVLTQDLQTLKFFLFSQLKRSAGWPLDSMVKLENPIKARSRKDPPKACSFSLRGKRLPVLEHALV